MFEEFVTPSTPGYTIFIDTHTSIYYAFTKIVTKEQASQLCMMQ